MELLSVVSQVIDSVADKLFKIISTVWGRVGSIIVFFFTWLVSWLGDTREMCVYLILTAIVLDLGWGIASSVKRGSFAVSIGFTKTGIKLAIYLSILTLAVLAEKAISDDWYLIFHLATAVLVVAEGVSICGHILIVNPNTPVIRLLWKVLKSEIAKKLGIEVKDLDDYKNEIISKK